MHLSFDLGDGTTIGLVGPTVFAIGADDRFIVVKRHPGNAFGDFDRAVTQYFIIKRKNGGFDERKEGVRGPMTSTVFHQQTKELNLPPFTKTVKALE